MQYKLTLLTGNGKCTHSTKIEPQITSVLHTECRGQWKAHMTHLVSHGMVQSSPEELWHCLPKLTCILTLLRQQLWAMTKVAIARLSLKNVYIISSFCIFRWSPFQRRQWMRGYSIHSFLPTHGHVTLWHTQSHWCHQKKGVDILQLNNLWVAKCQLFWISRRCVLFISLSHGGHVFIWC